MVKPILGKPAESSSSKYKGVRKRKWGKWVSEIRLPNSRERIWLGSYDSAEKAARAFDAALFCLRGRSAKFNFPDNPPDIVGAGSLTPPEIQVAASRFANSSTGKQPQRCSSSSSSSSSSTSSSSSHQLRPRESPSPSISELDRSSTLDGSFLDLFATVGGSENNSSYTTTTTTTNNNNNNINVPDYGIFPGFDDLSFDDPSNEYYFPPPPPSTVDYGEDIFDVGFSQDSFLWNF